MPGNTFGFLRSVVDLLVEADLPVWVFGGWAEELWQIAPKRTHVDIDFLCSAVTFEQLDRFLAQTNDFREILAKRFSHKRAVLYQHVLIEFLLVQGSNGNYFTDFFSMRYHLEWPTDVFCQKLNFSGYDFQVASPQALSTYRQHHERVERAYRDFLNTY